MTQEEKAKRYDEALESIKELYSKGSRVVVSKEEFENIFPELQESEDERISGAIIEHFAGSHSCMYPYKGFTKEQILAWLEKQAPNPKWSDEDEKNWCGIIDEIEANKSTAPIHDIKTYDRFLSWMDNIKQRMGGEE